MAILGRAISIAPLADDDPRLDAGAGPAMKRFFSQKEAKTLIPSGSANRLADARPTG
jgi:hypothetical protein